MEGPAAADLVIAVLQRRRRRSQQRRAGAPCARSAAARRWSSPSRCSRSNRKNTSARGVAGVRCSLDQAERGGAVGADAAQLAVEIGLPRRQRRQRRGDRRVFVASSRARCGSAAAPRRVEPRMHAVAVELDFVQPIVALRRRSDQLRQLRLKSIAAAPLAFSDVHP